MITTVCGAGGVLCVILIRQVAAGAALGAILGLLAAIGAHRLHFGWVRDEFLVVLDVVFIVVLTLVAVGKPTSTMMASSAMSGGLAIVAAADHFMSGRFLAYVAHQVRDGMQSDDFVGMSFCSSRVPVLR
ncbi:unnamed protein product (mitochondrion) [Plasmodiophora brassicae]|uniref:Uncharacterized protein n=1 Tax=Plasmodiophora brassicae TaxID=37360 RepID=A0A3P3YNE5_PLABS|nr:unnamed protein product [Plasmodiophora brassicae]